MFKTTFAASMITVCFILSVSAAFAAETLSLSAQTSDSLRVSSEYMFWWACATVLWLMIWVYVLARRKPGYSHVVHTISELGEVSAPDQRMAAYVVFLPVGLSFMIMGAICFEVSRPLAALLASFGTGYLMAAFFPCDVGSPVRGSQRQDLHNLGGAIEYLGGGAALLMLGEQSSMFFRLAGMLVILTAVLLTVLPQKSARGAVQRVGECVLMFCLIVGVWQLG